jgi:hypothetical protein
MHTLKQISYLGLGCMPSNGWCVVLGDFDTVLSATPSDLLFCKEGAAKEIAAALNGKAVCWPQAKAAIRQQIIEKVEQKPEPKVLKINCDFDNGWSVIVGEFDNVLGAAPFVYLLCKEEIAKTIAKALTPKDVTVMALPFKLFEAEMMRRSAYIEQGGDPFQLFGSRKKDAWTDALGAMVSEREPHMFLSTVEYEEMLLRARQLCHEAFGEPNLGRVYTPEKSRAR